MSEMQSYFANFSRLVQAGELSDPDSNLCECGGKGMVPQSGRYLA